MSVKCHIGIDWGTHSSKICLAVPPTDYAPTLFSSDLLHENDQLVFSPTGEFRPENIVRRLKSDLIEHSLRFPFWSTDDRPDTGTSLGEAVVFSIMCLLTASRRQLHKEHRSVDFRTVELGFSFPNWLAEDDRKATAAAQSFCEAVSVAVTIVTTECVKALPAPGKPFSIATLKAIVDKARAATKHISPQTLTIQGMNTTSFRNSERAPEWKFVVESGAAGLPYLRAMRLRNDPGTQGLAKLLVIDVGAGSTDVGYMLKTSNVNTAAPAFYYFHPASTFAEAGNALTDDIMKHHQAKNDPITWSEAEAQKVSKRAWHKLPFVDLWVRHICDHVAQYVRGVPDQRWLPLPMKLHVVVTGGSGLVPTLKEQLEQSVVKALKDRRFSRQTCKAVQMVDKYQPRFNLSTEAEVARMAVCFGAADPDKPGFRYIPKMDPPSHGRPTLGRQPWV